MTINHDEQLLAALEAILIISAEPVSLERLCEAVSASPEQVQDAFELFICGVFRADGTRSRIRVT